MKYPDIDYREWAEMFNLRTEPRPCKNCGKLLTKTIPFEYDQVRGLKSAPHGCPDRYTHMVSMTLDEEENAMLRRLFDVMKEQVD